MEPRAEAHAGITPHNALVNHIGTLLQVPHQRGVLAAQGKNVRYVLARHDEVVVAGLDVDWGPKSKVKTPHAASRQCNVEEKEAYISQLQIKQDLNLTRDGPWGSDRARRQLRHQIPRLGWDSFLDVAQCPPAQTTSHRLIGC